jgi:hypothetical protein
MCSIFLTSFHSKIIHWTQWHNPTNPDNHGVARIFFFLAIAILRSTRAKSCKIEIRILELQSVTAS